MEGGWFQKRSEVRPQGGHVYNYKALQRVGGEPPVLQTSLPTGSQSINPIYNAFDNIYFYICLFGACDV